MLKRMLHFLLLLPILFVCGTISTCKSPTKPPPVVQLPVIDTTSQDFTITTWEYGDTPASSYANDVWVFNENNIWVVGLFAPTTKDPNEWNIMQWNGTSWNPRGHHFNSSGIYAIHALDSNDIFFATGYIARYKDGVFIEYPESIRGFQRGQSVDRIWASTQTNVWGVGAGGAIVHYDGNKWNKFTYPESYNFKSITGSIQTGRAYAYARTSSYYDALVQLDTAGVTVLYQGGGPYSSRIIETIMLYRSDELWCTGGEALKFTLSGNTFSHLFTPDPYFFSTTLCKDSENDVFFFGIHTEQPYYAHYNGVRTIVRTLTGVPSIWPLGSSTKSGIAVTVGMTNNRAGAIIIRRMKP